MTIFRKYLNLRDAFTNAFKLGNWRNQGVLTGDAERVLSELREFCRADTPCATFDKNGHYDTHATAVLQGRREVWLRITRHINLTDDELLKLRGERDE